MGRTSFHSCLHTYHRVYRRLSNFNSTDAYDGIDGMKFAEIYSPIYEQLGMGITDIFVKEKETNGIAVTEILYKVYMFDSAFYMMTTQYIFHVDDLTYTLVTTVVSDRQFRNKLFTSLELVQ